MQEALTLKCRLYPDNKTAEKFQKLSERYRDACDDVSKVYFGLMDIVGEKYPSQTKLHKRTYYYIRKRFGLKSQLACSVPKTVIARYRSTDTLMNLHPYKFQDKDDKQWYHCWKNKFWMWNPIHFRRPQVDLVYGRDWSFVNHKLSIINPDKGNRLKVSYYLPYYFKKRYLDQPYKFGTSKLLKSGGKWYLNISCTIEVSNFDYKQQTKNLIGVDRGLRFNVTTYDNHEHSVFINGRSWTQKRRKFLHQRKCLQLRGTESAKRKLKQISGRENRWMTDKNHQSSKALVQRYGKNSTFALEKLRGVRFSTESVPKKQRYTQVSWPFYQLGNMLAYKAHLNSSEVIHVNPQYTSQRCYRCGRIIKENRNHRLHLYHCPYCGFSANDDRLGAMNIRWLGNKKVHSKKVHYLPKIKFDKQVGSQQMNLF